MLVFRLWFYNSFGFRSERSDEGRSGGAGPAILGSPRWASTPALTTACFAGDFQADDQQANDLQAENADDDRTVTAGPWDRNCARRGVNRATNFGSIFGADFWPVGPAPQLAITSYKHGENARLINCAESSGFSTFARLCRSKFRGW